MPRAATAACSSASTTASGRAPSSPTRPSSPTASGSSSTSSRSRPSGASAKPNAQQPRDRRERRRRGEGAAAPGAPAASRGEGGRPAANFELGRKLQLRYDAPKITTPVAKLLALLILDRDADKLAGRGLRYVREDWQIVETKEVRGKTVEKTRYPEGYEAAEQLYAQIERARTPEQVIGRLLQALIAAHAADEEALAASARVYYDLPGRYGDGPSGEIQSIARPARQVRPSPRTSPPSSDDSDEPGEADAA